MVAGLVETYCGTQVAYKVVMTKPPMKIGDKVRFRGDSGLDVEAEIVGEVNRERGWCWIVNVPGNPHLQGAHFNKIPTLGGEIFYNYGNMAFWIERVK